MHFGFHRWSLGAKLAGTFAMVILLVVLVVSISLASQSRRALEQMLRDRGSETAQNLARLSAGMVLEEDLWGIYKVVRDIAAGADAGENVVVLAAVSDSAGKVLAHSDPERHPTGEPIPDAGGANPAGRGATWGVRLPSGETLQYFTAPVVVDRQQVATALVGVSSRRLEATISRITREALLAGFLLALLGAALGFLVARRMTRPLTELGAAVDRIGAGDLDEPPAVITREKDEIGRLAERVNLMARRLRDSQRETREAQARLIRSERLASLGECAGSLAHEIRNPLGAVVAASRMLSSEAPQARSYDRERLAGVVADEARRLSRILGDFLVFARPQPPSPQPHSMNGLVGELVESLRLDDLAQGKRIHLRLGTETSPCDMDRDQLKQVLWNLLRNALEAVPAGGAVAIETAAAGEMETVEVTDDGPGIPPECQVRLFEPFYTTKKGGSGLGLASAHRIVTAHGGTIAISSRPGEGTRVRVTLPLRARPGRTVEAA